MRKVTVANIKDVIEINSEVGGDMVRVGDETCETLFGHVPERGESRSYYIVPAGDVAELELEKIQTDGKPWNLSGEQCAVGLSAMEVEGLFGLLHIPDGLTNITAIVHPPDEPKEDTVDEPHSTDNGEQSMMQEELLECDFNRDIAAVINKHSRENTSNTPDFILAEFLRECLSVLENAVHRRDEWYDVELQPGIPAKQPIVLKRNNTPTRPGNYVRRFQSDSPCPSQVFEQHGKLGYRDRSGSFCLVGISEWWSDELGPIEFEAEPEPPPMPKCGWFEWEGSQYRCIEDPNFRGDFVVFPPMEGQSNWSQTALDIKGITIHWYGDDA